MAHLPTGTVTFLYADMVESTRLVQQLGARYAEVLADYRRLIRAAIRERNGREVNAQGDACLAVFPRARDAVVAAVAAQRAVAGFAWPAGAAVRVRMGLHTGEPLNIGADYIGIDVHKAARIGAIGHGGQILLSTATCVLVRDDLPEGIGLRDLGEHRLKDLTQPQRVFQIVTSDLPSDFPPLQYSERVPHNLPVQLTRFIGREREIAEVKRLFSTARLLTLTGAGGIGKTRLALQVAAEMLEEFKDGVWLVQLESLEDPALVAQTVAIALGVREMPDRPILATLSDFLKEKQALLVLDNCEHLVAVCAHIADSLLRACPHLRILATSRESLKIAGETSWPVPPLSLPDVRRLPSPEHLSEYEAIRLFVARAVAAAPAFTVSDENAEAVAWVCHQLDGIPLALELAAACVKVLSVHQIAARLDDRFRLLTEGGRTTAARHQTLRSTIDWSFNLLSGPERSVLSRLSVFAGGFTLDAAEAVCAGEDGGTPEVFHLLARLAEKSLVLVEDREGDTRYRLYEIVRQYSREKLQEAGEAVDVRRRHGDWYLRLAERAEPELLRADQSVWLRQLEAERDNFREALERSVKEPETDAGLRLANALYMFWSVRGYLSEGRRWLERALAGNAGPPAPARVKALYEAGLLAYFQHDYDQATAMAEVSLAQSELLGEKGSIAFAHYLLGYIAEGQGDCPRATTQFQRSLALFREVGHQRGIGLSLNMLGDVARCQSDYVTARSLYEQDLTLRRELQDERGIAIALHNLGHVTQYQGDYTRASELFKESLATRLRLGHKLGIANCLGGLGGVAAGRNQPERAAKLLGAAEVLLGSLGAEMDRPDRLEYDRAVAVVRAALGQAAFDAALLEGRTMALEQAIEYALSA